MFHSIPSRAICRAGQYLRRQCDTVSRPAHRVHGCDAARCCTATVRPGCRCGAARGCPGRCLRGASVAPARRLAGRVREKPGALVGVPGFVGACVTTCDYSTRQALTPPLSFFVAVFQCRTCRAQLTNATAAGLSGNSTESPGTISRSSDVIRFVTVLRGGGGMFFVIIGRVNRARSFPCQSAKSFSLLARFPV